MTLATLSTPDKTPVELAEFPEAGRVPRNFEDGDLDVRPKHPSEVVWTRRWHLKVPYERLYHLYREGKVEIRSVRTVAMLLGVCTSQGYRIVKALAGMGLLDVEWGQCARYSGDGDPSIVSLRCFAHVEHVFSASVSTVSEERHRTSTSNEVFHMRELDPWGPDNELWDPSGLGPHAREVALAGIKAGPASINALSARSTVSWHATRRALHGLAERGMATCLDGLWTIHPEAITIAVSAQMYDDAVTAAQDLHHGGQSEEALAIVTALAYCHAVGNDDYRPRRKRYVAIIRHQRQEYREGPSCKWIMRSAGDRWGRVHYRVT